MDRLTAVTPRLELTCFAYFVMENNYPEMTPAAGAGRLRVLVWCPGLDAGGGARLLGGLVPALARRPEVELIRLLVPDRTILPSLDVGPVARLEIVPIPIQRQAFKQLSWLESSGRMFGIPGTLRLKQMLRGRLWENPWVWLQARLRQIASDCDLVYAFWPHERDFPDFGKPLVCTFHDATTFDFPEILGGDRTNLEYERARVWFDRSAKVIVPSEATRETLIRLFGESLRTARVIRHAGPPDAASAATPGPDTRRELPEKYFICLANLDAHKNLDTLLIAWSRFARRYFFPLVLAGRSAELLTRKLPRWPEGFQASRLSGLAHRLGIELGLSVYVLDRADDAELSSLIKRAYGLIVPALALNGGSFPAEEALAHGVPVCCSDIPVMREQLAGYSARISWFDPLSPESIAAAVGKLIDDYDEYKAGAELGMNDVRPTWDDVAQAYVTVFQAAAPRS